MSTGVGEQLSLEPVAGGFLRSEKKSADPSFLVTLVHPQLRGAEAKNRLKYRESLALGYLTAALEHHAFSVDWINGELERLGPEEIADRITGGQQTSLIGISLKSQRALSAAVDIAALVKLQNPGVHVTLGGLFPSSGGEEIIAACPEIDSCVKGEGEVAIVDLASAIEKAQPLSSVPGLVFRAGGEPRVSAARARVANLDALPFPARRDLEFLVTHSVAGATNANMLATRGCYAACTFCSIHQIYGDRLVMRRSPENVVAEMADLVRRFGVRRIAFIDDLFIHPSRAGIAWAFRVADLIDQAKLPVKFFAEIRADTVREDLLRRLTEVGLYKMFIGMEAGVQVLLDRMDKGCTVEDNERALSVLRGNLGLRPHQINFGYIMFEPDMTLDELEGQYLWLKNSGHATVQNIQNRMNVYWGTPQFDKMKKQGRLTPTAELSDRWAYDFSDPVVGQLERVFRQFHFWFVRTCAARIDPAREAFFERISEELLVVPADARVANVLAQLFDRINSIERQCYFDVFEHLLTVARGAGGVPSAELKVLREMCAGRMEELRSESQLLRIFAECVLDIEVGPGAAGEGSAWFDPDSGRWVVWLPGVPPDLAANGLAAPAELVMTDRYTHACDLIRISPPGKITDVTGLTGAFAPRAGAGGRP